MTTTRKQFACVFDFEDDTIARIAAESEEAAADVFARGGDFPPSGTLPVLVGEWDEYQQGSSGPSDWNRYVVAECDEPMNGEQEWSGSGWRNYV